MTGASLRKMIVEFVVKESARTIGTTTLGTAVHDQLGLSVSDYAEDMSQDGAWGCFTEVAAFALTFGCIVEVYEKHNGNFRQLFEFGPAGRAAVVRLAFNGRDHFEYLAAATEIAVGDQGRPPDPTAATRA